MNRSSNCDRTFIMKKIDKRIVEPVGTMYRVLAGMILSCSAFSAVLTGSIISSAPSEYVLILIFGVCIVAAHAAGSVVFTGYAPGYLLSVHSPRKLELLSVELASSVKNKKGEYGIKFVNDKTTHMLFVVDILRLYLGLGEKEALLKNV